MRISPQTHYDRTRWICDNAMLLAIVAAGVALLIVKWQSFVAASWAMKALCLVVMAILLSWPRMVMSRMLCEIFREATSAKCGKCGGPSRFDSPSEGLANLVTYSCRHCGYREHLKCSYADELPRREPGGPMTSDGLGGGGG